jgi:hypothetical protein
MTTLKKEVLEKYISPYFFETGTSGGEGVKIALEVGFEKIFTVEIDEVQYNRVKEIYQKEISEGRLFMFLGDSFVVMPEILEKFIDKQCTFWLDAHVDGGPTGVKRCPLLDELDYIKKYSHLNHKILIDDRRCFGGNWWGKGITEQMVIEKIKDLNNDYKISYEDGCVPNDVITAIL